MFAWVGSQLDALLGSYVLGVVTSLTIAIAPIALTTTSLWVLLYGWVVMRHEVAETVPSFLWRVVKITMVLAISLQPAVYLTNIADVAMALATGTATMFLPAAADPAMVTGPYVLLDAFNDQAGAQAADIMREASMFRLDQTLANCFLLVDQAP